MIDIISFQQSFINPSSIRAKMFGYENVNVLNGGLFGLMIKGGKLFEIRSSYQNFLEIIMEDNPDLGRFLLAKSESKHER
ncbi:hypothetical protein SNEBB_000461 [Seison nebaliae]|nr:hypothetical protein SNEBB_000461 [Seison nebaliae]